MMNKIFYDVEVFCQDWLFIANLDDTFTIIYNDKSKLKKFIDSHINYWFVGFNNYHYDDLIVADILTGNNPFLLSKSIIKNENIDSDKIYPNFKSIDLMQDIEKDNGNKKISLKKIMANLGLNIEESEVSFDIDRKLTKIELDKTIMYCKNDVLATKEFYNYRKDYISTKFILIDEFDLNIDDIRLNENKLVSKILKCKWTADKRNYLCFRYVNELNFDLIPYEISGFFYQMEENYRNGYSYEESIKMSGKDGKLKTKLLGIDVIYGIGGLHGCNKAKEYYNNMMMIDISSYYPTLMVNNDFYSHSFGRKDLYKKIYDKRIELKKVDIKKSNAYKLVLNKPTGCMRSNMIMRDYHNGNNIVVNGQLILTQLIMELKDYILLIQVNTDGILFKYRIDDKDKILSIINDFELRFKINFSIDYVKYLYQKNVNNYILELNNETIKAKGQGFKNYERNNDEYMNNSRSIIDKCRYEYYIHHKPVEDTVLESFNNNEIYRFQLITSYGSTYDKCVVEYAGKNEIVAQKVNRVFAVKDYDCGPIYKCKKVKKEKSNIENLYVYINGELYKKEKMPNSFDHCMIYNEDLDGFNKNLLDIDYYVSLCKKNL